jgi:hypothetical protein
MAALNFPNAPLLGDTYSVNTKTYTWNGTSWVGLLGPAAGSIKTVNGVSLLGEGDVDVTPTLTSKYSVVGTLTNQTGTSRWYPDRTILLTGMYFSLGTASTSEIAVTAKKNNVSIMPIGPLVAVAGAYKSEILAFNLTMTPDDFLTVDVAASSGANMAVTFTYK